MVVVPVPIGAKRIVALRGAIWKFVTCSHCNENYCYSLELEATGEEHDLLFLNQAEACKLAREKAERNFLEKSRNVIAPVPCPNCGFYQDDMVRQLKEDASINGIQVAGMVLALLAAAPLMLGNEYAWIGSAILAVVATGLLIYGYVAASRFDPNMGDSKLRKALGQKTAVWGEQLAELLAAKPTLAQDNALKPTPHPPSTN